MQKRKDIKINLELLVAGATVLEKQRAVIPIPNVQIN